MICLLYTVEKDVSYLIIMHTTNRHKRGKDLTWLSQRVMIVLILTMDHFCAYHTVTISKKVGKQQSIRVMASLVHSSNKNIIMHDLTLF